MDRLFNFRDLGGHTTSDGRVVRQGRLYRSDSLHRLTSDDCQRLALRGVRTVLDMRRPTEIAAQGRVHEAAGFAYHNIHPIHREWDGIAYDPAGGPARYLADRYLDMTEEGIDGLGAALRLIAQPDTSALVFHCFAGKDRTGVLSALTLSLLGVPAAVIATDYAHSSAGQPLLFAATAAELDDPASIALPEHIVACPPEAMLLFLEGLSARYGSVRGYTAEAGVTDDHVEALRAHLLN